MRTKKIGHVIFSFSIVIFVFFILQALIQSGNSWFVDFEFAANLGNTLAGILSFISVVLIYFSFRHQTETFYINQFENKYFEQIKIHRENVQNMLYESPESTDKDDPDIKSNQ